MSIAQKFSSLVAAPMLAFATFGATNMPFNAQAQTTPVAAKTGEAAYTPPRMKQFDPVKENKSEDEIVEEISKKSPIYVINASSKNGLVEAMNAADFIQRTVKKETGHDVQVLLIKVAPAKNGQDVCSMYGTYKGRTFMSTKDNWGQHSAKIAQENAVKFAEFCLLQDKNPEFAANPDLSQR
jgi:hypothetical protein